MSNCQPPLPTCTAMKLAIEMMLTIFWKSTNPTATKGCNGKALGLSSGDCYSSLKPDNATAICGRSAREQNCPVLSAWEEWHTLSSLSITVTLANYAYMQLMYAAQFWPDRILSPFLRHPLMLQVQHMPRDSPWRKHVIAFTFPGW